MKFTEMNISNSLKQAIKRKGFVEPSPVQKKVIPVALTGLDVVGKAKTGTGKTAAFSIPIIEKTKPGQRFQVLVVVPTRELALQVEKEISELAARSNLKTIAVFGGEKVPIQGNKLKQNPEIVVGTPGRIIDFMKRGWLSFKEGKILVLDEADRMLDMGFRDDIRFIVNGFSRKRQTMLFSATMPYEVMNLAKEYLSKNKKVFNLSEDKHTVDSVNQLYMMVDPRKKVSALAEVLEKNPDAKNLIFCRTKRTVDWLEKQLRNRGIKAFSIHGDRRQQSRNIVLEKFKKYGASTLIATNVVARGIHVDDIDNVINFDFPQDGETYIHRIGRTARQGKKGKAISFCSSIKELEELERIAGKEEVSEIKSRFK